MKDYKYEPDKCSCGGTVKKQKIHSLDGDRDIKVCLKCYRKELV